MSLEPPNLDDRSFAELVEEARRRIQRSCPEWTYFGPGDPGMTIVELFAFLTELATYRMNRLPEKVYVELLRLLGVRRHPPAPARTTLRFFRDRPSDSPVEIPRGTRVTLSRPTATAEPPAFVTVEAATIPVGETEVLAASYHCVLVDAEMVGVGTGLPSQSVTVAQPPIVAPTGDQLDLVVAVEAGAELDAGAPALQHDGAVFRIWREVEGFSEIGPDGHVYTADRMTGLIVFPPAARTTRDGGQLTDVSQPLGVFPADGRRILVSYRSGGGPEGNVPAGALDTLKDAITGIKVESTEPATGGRAEETLENALARGPVEFHSLQRAVTASDFELVALKHAPGVARAKAFTTADLWVHATPGTVDVLLVPTVPEAAEAGGRLSVEQLRAQESESTRRQVQAALDVRKPVATQVRVAYTNYTEVSVRARLVVRPEEDRAAIHERALARLSSYITPLPAGQDSAGWPFGEALRVSKVYERLLREPGVAFVDNVRLSIDSAPDDLVPSVAADAFQPLTWYAACGDTLFRSLNDADSWEPAGRFPDERVDVVTTSPDRPGLLAVATHLGEDGGSAVHISPDCAESWERAAQTAFQVESMAWMTRRDRPVLLLGTDKGLYELVVGGDGGPVQVLVDPSDPDLGVYAVAAATDVRGGVSVAVAMQDLRGVYLSVEGAAPGTFERIGLEDEDIRVLAVQYDGPRAFLWAGVTASGGAESGKGCYRWELTGSTTSPEGWRPYTSQWTGGSVRGVDFQGTRVLAASHHAGVLTLDSSVREPAWKPADVGCGLPLRDINRFHPVHAVAASPTSGAMLVGGPEGVYRSRDGGVSYESRSQKEFLETVPLSSTWLFVSGTHEIDVVDQRSVR